MKVVYSLLTLLLLTACTPDGYVDPNSPKAYCKRIAGQATMIVTLRDQGTSKETLRSVLAIDNMEIHERESIGEVLEKAYAPDSPSLSLFPIQIELLCHQEGWTPKKNDLVITPVAF